MTGARHLVPLALVAGLACSTAAHPTSPGQAASAPPSSSGGATYDVDTLGVPALATRNYIDLDAIGRISRFRSSVGHDYHDEFESCRSMKHYFEPKASVRWSEVRLFAPAEATLLLTRDDIAGTQLVLTATASPAFTFIIFHVNPAVSVAPGTVYAAGQQLGTHVGPQTMSDIAVGVRTPSGYRLVSWFDTLSDGVFQTYAARGLTSRSDAIPTRQQRDADPLACNGDTFVQPGALPSWITLNGN